MPEPVKKKIRVTEAKYVKDADSIVLIGECEQGKIRHQIHSNSFSFGNKNKEKEMIKTAELMVGKNIFIVFDPDLTDKMKDHVNLRY